MSQFQNNLRVPVGGSFLLSGCADPKARAMEILQDVHLDKIKIFVKEIFEDNVKRIKIFFTGMAYNATNLAGNITENLSKIAGVCAACAGPVRLPEPITAPEPLTKTRIRSLTPRLA